MRTHLIVSAEPLGKGQADTLCKKVIAHPHLFISYDGDLQGMNAKEVSSLATCQKCVREWMSRRDKNARYLSEVCSAQEVKSLQSEDLPQ